MCSRIDSARALLCFEGALSLYCALRKKMTYESWNAWFVL